MLVMLMGVKSVSCRDVNALPTSDRACVIDVNAPSRWAHAHVPGARNLDPQHYVASDLPTDQAALLVFYCSNPMCSKAPRAARRAMAMGHTQVRVMSAGMQGWMEARLPVESAPVAATAG